MADLINFALPSLNASEKDSAEMKFIKNYLSMFTEQVKFFLNNIDSDNYTEAYAEALNSFVEAEKSTATQTEVSARSLENARVALKTAMATAAAAIKESEGGYIVFLDKDEDGQPDEFQILTQSPDYTVPQARWVFNKDGLAFFDANGEQTTVALTADGQIVANSITTGTLEGIGIHFDSGEIAGWIVESELTSGEGETPEYDKQIRQTTYVESPEAWYDFILKNDHSADPDKKVIYVNKYVRRVQTDYPTAKISQDGKSYQLFWLGGAPVVDKNNQYCIGSEDKIFYLSDRPPVECQVSKSGDIIRDAVVYYYYVDENGKLIRTDSNKTSLFSIDRSGNMIVKNSLEVGNDLLARDKLRVWGKAETKADYKITLPYYDPESTSDYDSETLCFGHITSGSKMLEFQIPIPTAQNSHCSIKKLCVAVRLVEGGYAYAEYAGGAIPLQYDRPKIIDGQHEYYTNMIDSFNASINTDGNGVLVQITFKNALKTVNNTTVTNNTPVSVNAEYSLIFRNA